MPTPARRRPRSSAKRESAQRDVPSEPSKRTVSKALRLAKALKCALTASKGSR